MPALGLREATPTCVRCYNRQQLISTIPCLPKMLRNVNHRLRRPEGTQIGRSRRKQLALQLHDRHRTLRLAGIGRARATEGFQLRFSATTLCHESHPYRISRKIKTICNQCCHRWRPLNYTEMCAYPCQLRPILTAKEQPSPH